MLLLELQILQHNGLINICMPCHVRPYEHSDFVVHVSLMSASCHPHVSLDCDVLSPVLASSDGMYSVRHTLMTPCSSTMCLCAPVVGIPRCLSQGCHI